MQLPPLTPARIIRRYQRFLADVVLDTGEQVTAHCPNTGSMAGCWAPQAPVQLSHSDNPKRKLAWTLERVDMGQGWVGVHTGRTNPVIEEGLKLGLIEGLRGYPQVRREVTFNGAGDRSRFDFLLNGGECADAWVEVKNVTLWQEDRLCFPDAVTQRGRKHLETLAEACAQGYRGVMVYALNRPEGKIFAPADEIDPGYGETLRRVVREAGVEVIALRIVHDSTSMSVGEEIPVSLS
ncbi:MAG: DNA/RNA nuclease SfsA [Candidatus Thiodiazotropha sp.]